MKRLAQCPACHKTYDTAGLAPESLFACSCGSPVAVPAANFDHTADVVRCSSCGAPQNGPAEACGYCGSAYTLHERDLDTVCPVCAQRLSRKANFCHGCGTAIGPAEDATAVSALPCPSCTEEKLHSRRLGKEGVTIMECQACLGYWLTHDTFKEIQKATLAGGMVMLTVPGAPQTKRAPRAPAQEAIVAGPRATPYYRPCPVCHDLMNRKNMSKDQGIIIDICRHHGVWFDADELTQLMAWLKDGGYMESQRREMEHIRLDGKAQNLRVRDLEKKHGVAAGDDRLAKSSNVNLTDLARIIFKLIA